MIVILRGHLNPALASAVDREHCLSDRNPTWPLELHNLKTVKIYFRLSDRNPTWPLEPCWQLWLIGTHHLSDRNPTWPLEPKEHR